MSKKIKVDFTGVESFNTASEGQHVAKIVTADLKDSQGGNEMIVVAFEVTKGADKGARVFENYPLVERALWKLKGMLQAIGLKCDGKVQLDLDKLIGKICIIDVTHEEYEGKTRAHVAECRRLEATSSEEDFEEDEDEDDEEEEKPVAKKKEKATEKKKAPMNPPEEDEDDDDDDWDEEDDEEEEPTPKKPVKKAAPKKEEKKPVKKAAKKSEPEEDEDDDDDWDEE